MALLWKETCLCVQQHYQIILKCQTFIGRTFKVHYGITIFVTLFQISDCTVVQKHCTLKQILDFPLCGSFIKNLG